LAIQIVDLFYNNVFKKYSLKYNIYRELYEKDLLGLEIRGINHKFSQNIKKIILSNQEICYNTTEDADHNCDLLVLGSFRIFKEIAKDISALGNEDLGLRTAQTIKNMTDYDNSEIILGTKIFPMNKSYIFGILNVTTDSFSDGGKYFDTVCAIDHGIQLIEDGSDVLDIGGESSRPGANQISEDEEIKRVIPVIEGILKQKPDVLISIDTTKSGVAQKALEGGAKIVNDISGFNHDRKILDVVKKYDACYVLMHMKGEPKTMQINPHYDDVVSEIYDYQLYKTEYIKRLGIKNIIIDPGIGFGKRVIDNLEIINRLNEFKGIGCPVMIGLSKKTFIGKIFDLSIDEREDPTLISETIAIKNGAKFIRTHNVKKTKFAIEMNKFYQTPELLRNV
jgi:dihydropteroate synthase